MQSNVSSETVYRDLSDGEQPWVGKHPYTT